MKKKNIKFFISFFFLALLIFLYSKNFKEEKKIEITTDLTENIPYNSNIIKDVNYVSKDAKGNEYIIDALIGEIDFTNSDVIYLTDVESLVKLSNSNDVTITSDFGKYNTIN